MYCIFGDSSAPLCITYRMVAHIVFVYLLYGINTNMLLCCAFCWLLIFWIYPITLWHSEPNCPQCVFLPVDIPSYASSQRVMVSRQTSSSCEASDTDTDMEETTLSSLHREATTHTTHTHHLNLCCRRVYVVRVYVAVGYMSQGFNVIRVNVLWGLFCSGFCHSRLCCSG